MNNGTHPNGWIEINISEMPPGNDDLIATTGHSHIYKYKDCFAVKIVSHERELEMMLDAGECAITPRGRVMKRKRQVGIIMDLGKPIDVTSLDYHHRKQLMYEMIDLVTALHRKGVLHGDIKLANLLRAPDGSLRLCDFEGAQREAEAYEPEEPTVNWMSRFRLENLNLPMNKADDFYALGLTIWEVFTGKVPFCGLQENEVEQSILAGETVDFSEIVDPDAREMVEKYMEMGKEF